MLSSSWGRICAVVVGLGICLVGFTSYSKQPPVVYYTVDGLEPDKWASAWLLSQRVESGAVIEVRPQWALSGDGIPFDVPGEAFYRKDGLTTFEVIAEAQFDASSHVTRLASVLSDMELNAWAKDEHPETSVIEHYFRVLQQNFDRNNVPLECYLGFFDHIVEWMQAGSDSVEPLGAELESYVATCTSMADPVLVDRRREYVPTVAIETILDLVAAGNRVVFVDTREPNEYEEGRIPGAINLPLRSVPEYPDHLKDADLVISYCVKDFRGYEVAQDLLEAGVRNSAIMEPYGIKGWVDSGLPIIRGVPTNPVDEGGLLIDCALDRANCQSIDGGETAART